MGKRLKGGEEGNTNSTLSAFSLPDYIYFGNLSLIGSFCRLEEAKIMPPEVLKRTLKKA
jgi:hypothetical protein